MQRAARQLIRLVTCDLRKALYMNTAFFHTAAAAAVAHHHHHQSAVASRPIHISVLQLLCPSHSGFWLIRCYCNGCSLPSLLTQDHDGLHATEQSKTDDLHFLADGNSTGVGKDGFESGVRQAVNQNSINASQPSADCMLVASTITWNQEKKSDGTLSTGGDKAGFSLVLLSGAEGEPNTKHTILHGVSTELHCIQSAKDSKKSKPEMLPSGIASQSVADRTIGGRNHVVFDGLSLSGDSIRSDLSEATSPSGTAPQALADRGVGDSNYVVLDGLSSLGDGIRSDLTEARVGQMVDQNSVQSSELSVDASLVSFILDQHGWGPHTEGMLQRFVGSLTPELVTSIVGKQKNAKVAMCFLEWAGNQEKYEHRAEIFTKVIGRLGKDMNFAAAWNVLEFMRKHGLKVDYAFSVFIHRLKSANMVDEVVKAMDYMGSLDVIPTVPLYTSALQLILKANNLGEAQRLYKQMHQSGLQPDIKLYGVLISGFGRAGKLDDAILFFKEMQSHGVTPDSFTYISLIRAFAAVGQLKNGQKICMEMVQNNCLPKVLSRLDLGCALHGVSSMEQIQRFLDDVEMKGHVISVYTYNNMLQHLLENEMLSEAIEVFHRLSGEVQACNGSSLNLNERAARPNLDSYSLLIQGLCKGGKLREAVHFYKEMLVRRLRPSTEICNCLLLGLSNAGLIYEAVELSKHIMMEKLIVDVETQKTFFRALSAAGYLSKALKIFETMKWRGCIDQSLNFHALIGVGW